MNQNIKKQRVLYQFPLSLYCEKTRWQLEYKRIDFICRNLMPGLHVFTAWTRAHQRSLPILKDAQQTIGDSTNIALYLENKYAEYPLLLTNEIQQQKILQLEDWFDELGIHVRRKCWSLAIDNPNIVDIFFNFQGYNKNQRFLSKYSKPLLKIMVRRTFQIYPSEVEMSSHRVDDAFIQIETWLQGNPDYYLVGDCFTLADLTAASMLAPLLGPENSPWTDAHLSNLAQDQREELRNTVVGQWVLRIYKDHRKQNSTSNRAIDLK